MSKLHIEGGDHPTYVNGRRYINAADGTTVAEVLGDNDLADSLRAARHIVACWNACEGIDTETLERVVERNGSAPLDFVKAQRDRHELLDALRELHEAESALFPPFEAGKEARDAWSQRKDAAHEKARALLAKHAPKKESA